MDESALTDLLIDAVQRCANPETRSPRTLTAMYLDAERRYVLAALIIDQLGTTPLRSIRLIAQNGELVKENIDAAQYLHLMALLEYRIDGIVRLLEPEIHAKLQDTVVERSAKYLAEFLPGKDPSSSDEAPPASSPNAPAVSDQEPAEDEDDIIVLDVAF